MMGFRKSYGAQWIPQELRCSFLIDGDAAWVSTGSQRDCIMSPRESPLAVTGEGAPMSAFTARLRKTPVIAGAKDVEKVATALEAGIGIIFFLTGTIFDLARATALVRETPAMLFAHVDLLQGVGKDPAGIRWLGQELGIHGIVSTRSNLIKAAQEEGLRAIQRLFVLDSEALRTGLKVVTSTAPDAVELLPGLVVPYIQHRIPFDALPPVIAGGLVETEAEVRTILKTPAVSISTSRTELWRVFGKGRKTGGG